MSCSYSNRVATGRGLALRYMLACLGVFTWGCTTGPTAAGLNDLAPPRPVEVEPVPSSPVAICPSPELDPALVPLPELAADGTPEGGADPLPLLRQYRNAVREAIGPVAAWAVAQRPPAEEFSFWVFMPGDGSAPHAGEAMPAGVPEVRAAADQIAGFVQAIPELRDGCPVSSWMKARIRLEVG